MKEKKPLISMFFLGMSLLWGSSAWAFTNADIYEAIISAHQTESRPSGMGYISKVEQTEGTYNTWNMLFRVEYDDTETGKEVVIGMRTTLRYAGNALYISHQSADVDRRVLKVVLDDVEGTIEDLKNYDSSDLEGFKSNTGHNGKHMVLQGSINVAGKSLRDVRDIVVELRDELASLYEELYEANADALEDYFEDVLDKDYTEISDTQTFVEVIGHGFTVKNQVKKRETKLGHWAWKVQGVGVETINHGSRFEEIILLKIGFGLSEYKTEKMYDELEKRVKSRLPKGAKGIVVQTSPLHPDMASVRFQYEYNKKTDGEAIRGYHEKFIAYAKKVNPDLLKITMPYVQAPTKQKVRMLSVEDFMALVEDGLESLPIHEAQGASGQWKFKYKNVAYIITNYKKHMMLSFVFSLPSSDQFNDAINFMEDEIGRNFASFADKYTVAAYRGSKRTIQVDMIINYGVLSSSDVTGQKIKEKYKAFTRKVAPELQGKLKSFVQI